MTRFDDAPGAPGRLPDFFIAGHHKSGTTALYEMLRAHPQIFMPDLKEPRYFASDLRSHFEPTKSGTRPHTLEEYLALFTPAGPEQRVGEASPSYLRSRVAAEAIAELRPDARIIAILREPASFLRSLHLHLMQERVEREPDFRLAVANELVTRGGVSMPRYTDHVQYVEQLRRFHAVFPREQVLVLIYDDYRRENEATVAQVLRFLDVDDTVPVQVAEVNTAVRVRSVRAYRALHVLEAGRGPAGRALKASAKALTTPNVRERLRALRNRAVFGAPRPAEEEFVLELRRRFKPQVQELSEYLDRDLVGLWGYDDVE